MQYEFPYIIILSRITMNMIKTLKPNNVYAFEKKKTVNPMVITFLIKIY
jgi:hypothetical protein